MKTQKISLVAAFMLLLITLSASAQTATAGTHLGC
jgi:hypothetical protein